MQVYEQDRSTFVEQFQKACRRGSSSDSDAAAAAAAAGGVGFFLLRHRLPSQVATRQLKVTRQFFDSSTPWQKQSISYEHSPAFRGYMAMGVENTAGATDWREQMEYAVEYDDIDNDREKEDSDNRQKPYYERLRAAENPWPDAFQPNLRPTTLEYVHHVNRIADAIRQTFCLALGLPAHQMDDIFDPQNKKHPPHWVLKLLSYPAVQDKDPSNCFGVGEHVDTNFLTLILQDAPGLQVWIQGEWVNVPHTDKAEGEENAFLIVNLGEQAQLLSNGIFVATPHRVLPHRDESKPRTSLALFYNPSLQTTIKPLPVSPEVQGDATSSCSTWIWDRPNRILGSVGENTFKSLARSHPKVLAEHHPDLELLSDGTLVQHHDDK